MHKLSFYSLLFLTLFLMGSTLTFAQEEMEDQLYWVREEIVKIEDWDKYEESSKKWVEYMSGAGLDVPYVRASQRNDGHYYYLIPLENYAMIDKFPQIFGSAIEKIGKDKWTKFMEENESSIAYHKDFIVRWSAGHSYIPEKPRFKPEESSFVHWIFFTYKLEDRKKVLNILEEWKELYKENNIPDGYSVWLVELGEQNNMIAISEASRDGESFYKAMNENGEKLKEKEQKLWKKLSSSILTMEQKYGSQRPDLGFENK